MEYSENSNIKTYIKSKRLKFWRNGMATIKDIAEKAGVTATTVSRVINNRGYISDETRSKVFSIMKEMNYHPNEAARALSKKHTNIIGVIVPHITHPFFSKLISNLESAASARNYKILLCNSKDQPEKEAEYLDMCISNKVAGIILCSKYVDAAKFKKLHIPIIHFEQEEKSDESITIQCDNYQGGRLAAKHLIDQGCKKLLHFGGILKKDMPADRRADGFRDICQEEGVESIVLMSDQLAYGSMHYQSYIEKGLKENEGVDGIFASSDLIASQVIQVCNDLNIKIPEQVKLVGFDDVMIATVTTPTITTIHQPIKEMSELSIEYIEKKLKGEMIPSNVYMPVKLIKRNST